MGLLLSINNSTVIELSLFTELISSLAYSAPGAGMAEINVMILAFEMFS